MRSNDIFDRVGATIGWDFSQVRCVSSGESWDFYRLVSEKMRKTDLWLDIGIGGGEKVLEICEKAYLLVGIDASLAMLQTAGRNLEHTGFSHVRFMPMDAFHLLFPDGFFDIITTRHCIFDPGEVARVIKPGGWFLTQQVEPGDKENIKAAFGRGQYFGETDPLYLRLAQELKDVGFSNVSTETYNATEYYEQPEDLIFLLKNTPIIPEFGETPEDLDILEGFIKTHQTDKGIMTNAKRSLIVAQR